MVKVNALVFASFALAPLILATSNAADSATPAARSVDDDLEASLQAREPFGGWIRRIKKIAKNRWLKKALPYAGMATKLIVRDEHGDLYIRDVEFSDLSERDLDELDMALEARGFDFEDFEGLEAREPRRKGFGGGLKKLRKLANKARPLAKFAKFVPGGAPLSLLARDFDEDELDARDYEDLVDLLEREFEDDLELDARDPWFGSKWLNKARKVHKDGANILTKVNDANSWLGKVGLREFDEDFGLEERDSDDDLELDARDPWFGSKWLSKARKVHKDGANVLNKVNDANRWLGKVGLRELEDEMEERSFEDLDALD